MTAVDRWTKFESGGAKRTSERFQIALFAPFLHFFTAHFNPPLPLSLLRTQKLAAMDNESELNEKTEQSGPLGRSLSLSPSSPPPHRNHDSSVPPPLIPSSTPQLMPPPTHPLEITDVLSLVVAYLPRRTLPTCACVSKTWYHV